MNLELLKRAQNYIENMANGINPLTNETVRSDDLINDVRISRCLFFVNDCLKQIIDNKGIKVSKSVQIPFVLTREEINNYQYYDNPVSISRIVSRINELKTNLNMKKLKVSEMCDWLISIGLLEIVEYNGIKYKRPTKIGNKMGMYVEHVVTPYREYDLVLYKKETQEFIIDNFEGLLEFLQNNQG